eukprot:scaffold93823_cov26-Tisochrysis_lutea.AAC.2
MRLLALKEQRALHARQPLLLIYVPLYFVCDFESLNRSLECLLDRRIDGCLLEGCTSSLSILLLRTGRSVEACRHVSFSSRLPLLKLLDARGKAR